MSVQPVEEKVNAPKEQQRALAVTGEVERTRAIAETMASIEIARRFPRDEKAAIDRIIQACTRPKLAEAALYSYARGGTEITGPSIRLAEAIAQHWGNMDFGIRELEQRFGESTVEAYAWDVETNTRSRVTFQVAHKRHTRERDYALTDPRDIYELVANMGARRLRSRILAVVPGDVVETAIEQVELSLKTRVKITPELLAKMIADFAELGVTKQMIEARIQRHFDAITPALCVQLGKIYNSLKDGFGVVGDYFKAEEPKGDEAASTPAEKIKAKLRGKKPATAEVQSDTPPPQPVKMVTPVEAVTKELVDVHQEIAEHPQVDERQLRTELRVTIGEAWKGLTDQARRALLTREYNKSSLLDLTTGQLADMAERMPQIMGGRK